MTAWVKRLGLASVLLAFGLWAMNTSAFVTPSADGPTLLAHRGVHQTYEPFGVGAFDCTATIIDPVTHPYIENTAPSIEAAFKAGASRVEVDIRVTKDGRFVIFHDDALGCRANGEGKVRDHALKDLRGLDLGHGYTHDGERFPLRGLGTGLLMTLEELVEAFPNRPFLFDLKDLRGDEGIKAGAITSPLPEVWATGTVKGVEGFLTGNPEAKGISRPRVKACLLEYLAYGWTGLVPEACHHGALYVPANYAHYLWGWPHRLQKRLEANDSDLVVLGDLMEGSRNTRGLDELEGVQALGDYRGIIWTNKIEVLGPALVGGTWEGGDVP